MQIIELWTHLLRAAVTAHTFFLSLQLKDSWMNIKMQLLQMALVL